MLTQQQIDHYHARGWIHIPQVFTPEHTKAMRNDLNWMIDAWANTDQGWTGPWRQEYMDEETEAKAELIAMHDLHFYAQSWCRGVTNDKLCDAMADLLGGQVELHHSTMHVKPPKAGQPFPMHQDWAFYQHEDNRYIDVLVHLDDTCHESGEIRFLEGTHKNGPLKHVTAFPDGTPCTPHLPTDEYRREDTLPVPAKAGDVVCFASTPCTDHTSTRPTTTAASFASAIATRTTVRRTARVSVGRGCCCVAGATGMRVRRCSASWGRRKSWGLGRSEAGRRAKLPDSGPAPFGA